MLTKPLSHLRPLLRLPSHTHTTHTQPDHFTSNPSLPHHLPRQGGRGQNAAGRSHALVQPGAAHTAGHGPGGAKGAGQGRGYGRESGTGSGYTGHARAFLSLPQGSHVDPNAGLATDETRDELSIPSTLSRPSYRASPPKATSPDLSLSESPFHDVRYRQTVAEMEQAAMEEEKRFGGVSELAGEWARARDTGRQATTEAEDVDMTEVERKRIPRRRSSISIAQLQSGSSTRAPSPMVGSPRMRTASPLPAFLPGHGPALSRTGSFMDVGLLGTIPGRPVVARAMSSATISRVQSPSPSSLLEETERAATPIPTLQSASSTRLVPQANRILMDLAGRDLPAPRSLGRRYNSTSTAAYRNNRSWADDVILSSPSSRPLSPQEMDDQARDKKIYAAIVGAVEHHQPALFHSLVQHYRSSRVLAPYDSRTVPGEEGMSHKFPLPSNWTANTYNAILTGLNYFRADGESVAPSLEIYNEMLERDVLPNGRTYAGVIQALSMRERDVWAAVQRWELERDWLSWREEKIGVPVVEGMADERKDLIQGYIAEGNMISALRLFRAAVTFHNTSGWKFMPETYFAVLDALSAQRNPDFAAVDHVFQHAYSRSVSGWRALSRYVFTAHAKRDDRKHLLGAWESFEEHIADIESGKAEIKLRDWLPRIEADTLPNEMRLARARGQMRGAYEAAIEAFVAVGDLEKAAAIFERATKSEMLQQTTDAGEARVSSELYSTYLAALAKHGHGAKAAEEYERLKLEIDHSLLGRLPLTGIVGLVDALVPAGQWRFAQTLLMSVAQVQIDPSSDGSKRYWIKSRSAIARLRKVYVGILAEAAAAPSAEEARKVIDLAQALADSDTTVSWPVSRFAFDLLDKHAFWDLGEAHAKMIEPFESDIPALVSTIHAFSAKASKELPLRQAIDVCVALAKPCGRLRLRDRASIFLERYGIERAALSDAHGGQQLSASDLMSFLHSRGWVYLLDLVSLRPYLLELPAFKEGEYDATLEQLVSDIETLQVAGRGKVINSQVSLVRMADALLVLRERFGATRMGQMAKRMFGEQADEFIDKADETWQKLYLRNFQMPAAVGQEDMGMGSPVQSVDSASQSGLASEDGQPSSATSFAPSSGTEPAAPKLHLDAGLTRDIDALLKTMVGNSSRQGQIALQAYNVLVNAYETGKVPAIASIARTISNLRRPGDEAPISHLYSIAQSALGSYVGSAISRATAWRTVEDSMIVACCHLGRLEQAGAHRARIIEAGMTPSADAYATMIASSKDTTDDALVAREMFDESQRLGVKPHLYLYNTIISKLSKARKVELALELFAHMKAAGVVPSSVTYGAVMNACTRVGDAQSAENLFEEMRMQRNFKPRVPPYNTMIQLFVQTTPNREKALHYYGLLRAAGVPPSAHTYKLLLDLHATLAPFDLAAAERVFRDIESDPSVSVQGSHFASLITGYGIYADNLDKALSVFESISARLDSETILSEAVVWEAVLNVIAHRGTLEQLQEMRQRMESTSTARPTAYVYNVLITGYARGGEIDTARALFESMGDSIAGVAAPNNHPVLHTSSGLPKPSTRTPAAVQQVGEGERVEVGVVFREPSTYEAMLRAELSVGDVERAQEVMRRMEQRGYPWAVVARVRAVLDEAAMAQIAQTAESSAPTSTA